MIVNIRTVKRTFKCKQSLANLDKNFIDKKILITQASLQDERYLYGQLAFAKCEHRKIIFFEFFFFIFSRRILTDFSSMYESVQIFRI